MKPPTFHTARISAVDELADGVFGLEFRRVDGKDFPTPEAGDHVRVKLPSGIERSYSVVNAPGVSDCLRIAVQLEKDGRGGSKEMCGLGAGATVEISEPLNSFPLDPTDHACVLIAGGIGITPIWSMIQHLEEAGRSWRLHYASRSPQRAAYLTELRELERVGPGRVWLAFSSESERLSLEDVLATVGENEGVYCCGPDQIVQHFRQSSAPLGDRAHWEDFTAARAAEGNFTVELQSSGVTLEVPDGTTILDAVLDAGIEADYSCMSGTCGTCVTKVLSGEPDHRDYYLTDEEKAAGDQMMICCSGVRVGPLVLDL